MREIKFRGKRKDNGEWVYGYYLVVDSYHLIIQPDAKISFNGIYGELGSFGAISTRGDKWPCEVIPETVGQYTGQKDKNKKKIYEGDILKSPAMSEDSICEVYWDVNCWFLKDQYGSITGLYPHSGEFEPEIIGNIHKEKKNE